MTKTRNFSTVFECPKEKLLQDKLKHIINSAVVIFVLFVFMDICILNLLFNVVLVCLIKVTKCAHFIMENFIIDILKNQQL